MPVCGWASADPRASSSASSRAAIARQPALEGAAHGLPRRRTHDLALNEGSISNQQSWGKDSQHDYCHLLHAEDGQVAQDDCHRLRHDL